MTAPDDTPVTDRPPDSPPADEPVGEAGDGGSDALVEEIKKTLADLADRALATQRRERELEHQYRRVHDLAYRAVQHELRDVRTRLEQRSAALDKQAVQLAARSAELDQSEQLLAERQRRYEAEQRGLDQALEQLRRREQAQRRRRDELRRTLLQRIAVIRAREVDLAKRIRAARDEIQGERAALAGQARSLAARAAELERQGRQIDAAGTQRAEHLTELRDRAAQLERQQAELERARQQLVRAEQDLDQRRSELGKQQDGLERQARAAREQHHRLAREHEQFDAQRRLLQEQEAALEERSQRLEQREQRQQEAQARIDQTARELREARTDLDALRASTSALHEQARAALGEAARQRDEATVLREQLEAREADARQTGLQLEVERQELERERAALTAAREDIAHLRARWARETQRSRAELERHAERLRALQRSPFAVPARWWLRSGVLALAVALPAFWGWLAIEQPRHRSRAELLIVTTDTAPSTAAAVHAARILSPGLIENALPNPALAREWAAALADGRVGVARVDTPPAVRLSVTAAAPAAARRLAQAAAEAYRDQVNHAPPQPRPLGLYSDLTERRATVARELATQRTRGKALRAKLRGLAAAPRPDELYAQVQRLQARVVGTVQALEARRAELESLRSRPNPRATVAAETYAQALAADPVYQEDLKELRAEARKYRAELAVAMVLLVDALRGLRQAGAALARTVAEQQALEPPPAVRAVLEACGAPAAEFERQLAQFAHAWDQRRQRVERWKTDDDVAELVGHQNAAADAARRLVDRARGLAAEVQAQLERLTSAGAAGTRGIVVAALLRAELGSFTEQVATLAEAAAATDVTTNFRLETHDRQLRGIRTRMRQRRETIVRRVDDEANRRARQEHEERLRELRRTVGELEETRENLLLSFSEQLDGLRAADRQWLARQSLEAELGQTDSAVERLTTQLARLDEALARAGAGGPSPDRIQEDIPVHSEQVAGVNRYRNAALAAAAGFAATWLIALVMILKNPLRRPRAPLAA